MLTNSAFSRATLRCGKVLTLRRKLPLNCGYSKQGKFPLGKIDLLVSVCIDKEARSHDDQLAVYSWMACLFACSGALTPDENVISTPTMKTNVLGNISALLIELVCCVANS